MTRQRHSCFLGLAVFSLVTGSALCQTTSPAQPPPGALFYTLSDFGPVATPVQAQATFLKASAELIQQGGGVLVIPPGAAAAWTPRNDTQEEVRIPPAPAPAKTWHAGIGVTVIDVRGGVVKVLPPQISGFDFARVLDLPQGQSLPHWEIVPMVQMTNDIRHGSTSYRDWLQEDVASGPDRRFYVATIRGIFPGMFLNGGDYGTVQRLYVKGLGYDPNKQMWYFTADCTADIHKGSLLHNKNHVNVMRMDSYSHNENQTFDVMLWRHNYSQGDNYLVDARFKYMSDVHSTAGDENGVIYGAFVESEMNNFRAKVASWDPNTGELKYTAPTNADTLGSGRPIINLNPAKWITQGQVWIVPPASATDDSGKDLADRVFQGKSYPTTVEKNRLGVNSLRMGGLIRLSAEAPVDQTTVGRYFAVDEPNEYVPGCGPLRRWYLIDSVTANADGTKDIRIVRHWWGAKSAGAPMLYKPENYSWDGHERPLKYVIAPGVNAYDVSDGVEGPRAGASAKIIRLAPSPFQGTASDFAAGDAIEQAIGPDPFRPVSFRSWLFEKVPGAFPAAIFDIANMGQVARSVVLTVRGGSGSLEKDAQSRYDCQAPWQDIINIYTACQRGIIFSGDVADAAIAFQQPNDRPQAIKWRHSEGKKETSLTVSPADGTMKIEGGSVAVPGGMTQAGGLSGSAVPANNLRGIAVPVKAGSQELTVQFPRAEPDAAYGVFLETSWLTVRAVAKQTPEGFVVQFQTPPAADATLHWMIVR